MHYEPEIRRRLLPLVCTTKTNPVVSMFDVVVKVTLAEPEFDIDEVTKVIEQKPYGPWFAKVRAVHGQVLNVHLSTLPPADAAPVPLAVPSVDLQAQAA